MKGCALCTLLIALAAGADVASAAQVTYQAQITIHWYNGFVGERTTTESNATVVVDYPDASSLEILSLTFSEAVPGLGTMTLGETGSSTGTIAAGVATGTVGYAGSLPTPLGTFSLLNVGGPYSGTMSGAGGTRFVSGDVYQLQAYNSGTTTPPVNGQNQWDHLITGTPTKIVFGVPEPATMLLLLGGGVGLLCRRRA